jgi:hypothetical protein
MYTVWMLIFLSHLADWLRQLLQSYGSGPTLCKVELLQVTAISKQPDDTFFSLTIECTDFYPDSEMVVDHMGRNMCRIFVSG